MNGKKNLENLDQTCEDNDLGGFVLAGQGVLIPGLAKKRSGQPHIGKKSL
jgi:hypothetical protein